MGKQKKEQFLNPSLLNKKFVGSVWGGTATWETTISLKYFKSDLGSILSHNTPIVGHYFTRSGSGHMLSKYGEHMTWPVYV